jgi:ribonuclease D
MRYNQDMLTSLKNTELVWIDQPQKLREVVDELSAQDILAVDTESNSLYAYQEQVCLIQFSTREKDILIDALVLPDLSDLAPIFSSDRILKVFHAAEYDLICLFRDYGFRFNYLFDTMIAARTLGYQKIGLSSLLENFFDVQMNKKYQRANWGKRPLKPDMLEYARLDSHYLIPLQKNLRAELDSSGLWKLALEDFQRLTKDIEDTTETSDKDFWKLHGARDLSPAKAAVLKSLYQFREKQAEAQDRPPFKVISHQALVEIARICPKHTQALSKVSKLNDRLVRRYGNQLIKAVQEGKKAPSIHPPHHKRPADAVLERIDALREWRKFKGRNMGVPSDVVLPRDVLNRIAQSNPSNLSDLEQYMLDVPYRFNRFGTEILKVSQNGRRSK